MKAARALARQTSLLFVSIVRNRSELGGEGEEGLPPFRPKRAPPPFFCLRPYKVKKSPKMSKKVKKSRKTLKKIGKKCQKCICLNGWFERFLSVFLPNKCKKGLKIPILYHFTPFLLSLRSQKMGALSPRISRKSLPFRPPPP
jgi:hypothetical protein